jgi:DNA polymerase III subunit beta
MRLSTQTKDLLERLGAVARVASTRSAVQALAGVQVSAGEGGVELRATDQEVGLRVPLAADVQRPGEVVLPARLLLDIVRSLRAGETTLEQAEGGVVVSAGTARFTVRTLRAEDFPPLPEPGGDQVVQVPAPAFVDTVDKVRRSASRDETRPILTGILVSAASTELRMVATDSYRLSVKETALEQPLDGGFEANVPARALEELRTVVAGAGAEHIEVGVRTNQVVFRAGGVTLSSRLIDGQFPNYRQLLPEGFEHELRVDGRELLEVIERVAIMAQKNAPLRLRFEEGQLTVSAQTPDVGEASEPMPVPFAGEPFEIGFNPQFLREGLQSVDSGDVLIKLISPLRPGLIEAGDGSGFQYLIMPIRLNV